MPEQELQQNELQEQENDFSLKSLFVPLTAFKAIHWIVIVGLIVFFNVFFNGFVGDDETQIVNNPAVHSIANIPQFFTGSTFYNGSINKLQGLYYRPVMSSLYAIVYTFFGLNAFPYHALQVLLHILNAVLVFLIFRYFFNTFIAVILALVFLVHPVNSETVSYISNFQDILFFFFGSFALYLELFLKKNFKKLLLIAVFLLLSLFSKETSILFVAVILVYEFLFQRKSLKKTLLINIIVIAIYMFFRAIIAHITFHTDTFAPIMRLSVIERLLNVPSIFLYYVKTAFFPSNLAVSQQWIVTFQKISEFYLTLFVDTIIIAGLIGSGMFLYKQHKNYFKTYLLFNFWFLIGILFHSQIFFTLDNTVADRWFYFSLFGMLGIIGILLQIYITRCKTISRNVIVTLLGIILVILSIRTMVRNANFYNNYTLYSHDIHYSKESSLLESGLGKELFDRGQYKAAESHLLQSVQLDPKGYINWNTLGVYYERTNQIEKARNAYRTAINNNDYFIAYQNYSLFLLLNDKPEIAEKFVRRSIQKFPSDGYLWQIYSLIEHTLGHYNEALIAAKYAVTYTPTELTYTIYSRFSQNLSLHIKAVATKQGKVLQVCPPACE
jgi:protein O-mannosyl-transferase